MTQEEFARRIVAMQDTTAVNGRLQAQADIEQNGKPYTGRMEFVNSMELPNTGDPTPGIVLSLLLASLALGAALVRRHRKKQG